MDSNELRGMSEEELAAALEAIAADEQPVEGEIPQEPQGVPAPQPSADEQIPPVEEQAPPPQQGGDLNVALRQEREARRQAQQERDDAIAYVQQFRQQQQAQPGPELAMEDPEAINYLIQQATAPMQQQMLQLQQMLQQSEMEKQMLQLRGQYPDIDASIAEFDTARPDLAEHYSPIDKHLLVSGVRASDPAYLKQKMQADLDAAYQKGRQDALAKLNQPTIKGPDGLARAGSMMPGIEKTKTTRQMSDAELAAKIKELS